LCNLACHTPSPSWIACSYLSDLWSQLAAAYKMALTKKRCQCTYGNWSTYWSICFCAAKQCVACCLAIVKYAKSLFSSDCFSAVWWVTRCNTDCTSG
jgi:hypothetical protein